MKDCKYKSGYTGKDSMREQAHRLLKGDIDAKVQGAYPSISAPQNLKRRPYKAGGHVPRNKSARNEELHISKPLKPKNVKRGLKENSSDGFYPKNLKKGGPVKETNPKPIIAGKHPMIGMKKKSPKLSGAKKMKVKSGFKAKSLSYDASHGTYMRKGGKVNK